MWKILIFLLLFLIFSTNAYSIEKKIAYLVSDIRIPFWSIMAKGIQKNAQKAGYELTVLSAHNLKKKELQNMILAIDAKVDGIIISPISSSTCTTLLNIANRAKIPVVISDVGTDGGEYVSFISSDNFSGAYSLGKLLVEYFQDKGYKSGSVGIVSIPQKRINGQQRTQGFLKALRGSSYTGGGLLEQVDFSYEETYKLTTQLLRKNSTFKAVWLQGSDRYQAALDAIKDLGLKGKVALLTFDAEPEFLDLIPQGILVAAAMQQPYLMGEKSFRTLQKYLSGEDVKKVERLEVLAISKKNIKRNLSVIKRNVLGVE